MRPSQVLVALFILYNVIPVYSGEWKNFTSMNLVTAIAHQGDSIWVGAYQGGLVLLDAATGEFTHYTKADSKLADNNISALAVDSAGSLHIGSRIYQTIKGDTWIKDTSVIVGPYMEITCKGGNTYAAWYGSINLWRFDGTKWDSVKIGSPLSSSFIINDILPIGKDSIWVGSYDGLYLVRNFSLVEKILTEPVNTLLHDSSGTILCGTSFFGVKKISGTTWTSWDTSNSGLPTNLINCMEFDSKNRLWLGTNVGLVEYDGSTWTVHNSANSGLPGNAVSCLHIDGKDRIWISVAKGVSMFDGKNCKTYSFTSMPSIQCVSIAHGNNAVWISHNFGVASFDGRIWEDYVFPSMKAPPAPMGEIYADTGCRIWADSDVALLQKNAPAYLSRVSALQKTGSDGGIVKDKNGLHWTTINGRLSTFDGVRWQQVESPVFPSRAASVLLACGYDGKMYIAGEDNDSCVLVCYDGNEWSTLFSKKGNDLWISALAIDTANNLWAGMSLHSMAGKQYGGGIQRFDGVEWKTFTINNSGIPSNTVWALEFDRQGNLWVGGSNGLGKFDGKEWTVYTTENSGLPQDFVNAITVDTNGNKWIATNFGGLAVFREGGIILPPAETRLPERPPVRPGTVINVRKSGNNIKFSLLRGCSMAISIHDLAGRCIFRTKPQLYDPGNHKLAVTGNGFANNGVSVVTFYEPDMQKQAICLVGR